MAGDLAELLVTAATSGGEPGAADRTSERLLDAALREVAAVGLARLTVEDVVRRAGVARMTAYRRFPRRDDLVAALVLREVQRFFAAVGASIEGAQGPSEGVVAAFTGGLAFARTHPVLSGAARDPGQLVDVVATDDGRLMNMGTAFIARYLHGDRPGEPSREALWVAGAFARLFVAYLAVPPSDPAFTDDAALREFAATVLAPMAERVVDRG